MKFQFEPIGTITSDFKEKFGIPRQAGLVKSARAEIRMSASKFRDAFDGLEGFSHIWVVFVFHQLGQNDEWKPRIRPPRLGGTKKIGVFASRSPHRPNPIGLSVVELEGIEITNPKDVVLKIRGGDFLDGTPVLDIKPYVRYADSIPRASQGWAQDRPITIPVTFSREALKQCRTADPDGQRQLKRLISEIVKQDPRPAFQRKKTGEAHYAFRLAEFDVQWTINDGSARIIELKDANG